MRHILIAAALAAAGFVASGPALAQLGPPPVYQPGGPVKIAGWCKVVTGIYFGDDSYGYYQPCPSAAMAQAPKSPTYTRSMRSYRYNR